MKLVTLGMSMGPKSLYHWPGNLICMVHVRVGNLW